MSTPLAGCRILVPRAEGTAGALVELLTAAGAVPHAVPLMAIGPPADEAAFDAAVLALAAGDYAWVGFASAHAVSAVTDRAAALGLQTAVPADTRVAAVGAATAAALRAVDLPVDLWPCHGGSAAVLAELWPHPTGAGRVLLPSSEIGLPVLADALTDRGYQVDRVSAYAPRRLAAPAAVAADLRAGAYRAVVLTSPSLAAAVAELDPAPEVLRVAIGTTTAAGATAAGLRIDAIATDPTAAALVTALATAVSANVVTAQPVTIEPTTRSGTSRP